MGHSNAIKDCDTSEVSHLLQFRVRSVTSLAEYVVDVVATQSQTHTVKPNDTPLPARKNFDPLSDNVIVD